MILVASTGDFTLQNIQLKYGTGFKHVIWHCLIKGTYRKKVISKYYLESKVLSYLC